MKKIRLTSAHLIPLSFLAAILIGTVFLALPISSAAGNWTPFTDALFTATTSVCVTGLVVKDTYQYWSHFGQVVILVLIQVGGIGVITAVSTMMMLARKRFSLSERLMLRDAMNLENLNDLLGFLLKVIRGTLVVEMIGALLYTIAFIPGFGMAKGIWVSVFTAISAFCNAGIDVLGPDSLAPYQNNALIIMGGLGYVVWQDIDSKVSFGRKRGLKPAQVIRRFSEHTKLVLTLTGILIVAGTVFIFAAEFGNPETLGTMPIPQKILNSLFESVTFRTAGFATFSQAGLRDVSCLAAYLLMFIGGSPIGTAGGVKTTTFYLAILNSYVHGKNDAHAYKRSVSEEAMRKATAIIEVSVVTVMVLTLLLVATNPVGIEDGLFEIVSACATVGLTRNLTPTLNTAGKLIVTVGMYLGRIGPISMAFFLTGGKKNESGVHYAEGNFYIG